VNSNDDDNDDDHGDDDDDDNDDDDDSKIWGEEFLSELGHLISSVSGDQHETNFLFQRLFILVQSHNVIAFRDTLPDGCDTRAANWYPENILITNTIIFFLRDHFSDK